MFLLKANRVAILVSVFFFAILIFLKNFGVFTAPFLNFNLQKIEKLESNLNNLPINFIANYYNTILDVEPITSSLAIIFQYGIPIYVFV
jgi:hypothetical protein